MRVINKLPDSDIYILQSLITMRKKQYHVSRMREFIFDPLTDDPLNSALTDDHVYRPECIISMKGNPKGAKGQLFFRVRWLGHQASDDTWEPWTNVRKLLVLKDFLSNHTNPNVRALLPKNINYEEVIQDMHDDY